MDCNMPIMNGFQTSIEIHNLIERNEIKQVPILGLTANTSLKELEKCKICFMDRYLTKPVSKKKI